MAVFNSLPVLTFGLLLILPGTCLSADPIADLQSRAMQEGRSDVGHWGTDPDKYSQWKTHSNRLIPVYTFGTKGAGEGVDLNSYFGGASKYQDRKALSRLYGRQPDKTWNDLVSHMDQTDIASMQRAAAAFGKKYIFLVVFDGMDWETTFAAAAHNNDAVVYTEGRGKGTHFQEYPAEGTSQFGWMVTSPHNEGTKTDVNMQTVLNPGGKFPGGYDPNAGGRSPWQTPTDLSYLIGKPTADNAKHAYTDSASSATSMMAGIKTYNGAINVDPTGEKVITVAHELQEEGRGVGIVTSVPICHATPAAAYAHNVTRKDYQDIARDMLGLPSVAHPESPLPGLDVVIGCGIGTDKETSSTQGENFVPGNIYLTKADLRNVSVRRGGKYVTSVLKLGTDGPKRLSRAAKAAANGGHRLLGFYGVGRYNGHLPFQTANGDFKPVPGVGKAEEYSEEEIEANPTLADMTSAALTVLETKDKGFWLLVEAGDVDWANHDNNIDNAIGAVNSGDAAVKVITDWVEENSSWDESMMIVTADHGHLFCLKRPELLTGLPIAAED